MVVSVMSVVVVGDDGLLSLEKVVFVSLIPGKVWSVVTHLTREVIILGASDIDLCFARKEN
jgi:hypothetical protein